MADATRNKIAEATSEMDKRKGWPCENKAGKNTEYSR